ncbi:MAG: GNAT family N-acetyltransferase [Actinomycetota bacterium]
MDTRLVPIPVTRELNPADGEAIIDLFESLSPEDRFYRFFRAMPFYPPALLELLTAVDGVDHLAVGAFKGDACIGVARCIRYAQRPTVAELAVTVSPDHRGRGLAGRLITEVELLAAGNGIETIEIDVHADNRAAARLFRGLGFALVFESGSLIGTRTPAEFALAA